MVRRGNLIVGLLILTIVAALTVAIGGSGIGTGGEPSRKNLEGPKRFPGPPQIPEPSPPTEPTMLVSVTNFPIDLEGHLVMRDHSDQTAVPRQVEVVNLSGPARIVGFTSATTLPNVGVFGMSRICGSEYTGSRMCDLYEALSTVDPPDLSSSGSEWAWIMASRDPSAHSQCGGWGSTQGEGPTLSREGVVSALPCNQSASVACCAPSP